MAEEFADSGKMRRIALLGPRGVGKTAVSTRFYEDSYDDIYTPTIEDSYQTAFRVDGQNFLVEILDSAGQDEFSHLGPQLTIGVHGYFLVFSVRDQRSFDLIQSIYERLFSTLSEDKAPLVLVGNQIDVPLEREVPFSVGKQWADKEECPYVETSAKTGVGVRDAFKTLVREMERMSAQQVGREQGEGQAGFCSIV